MRVLVVVSGDVGCSYDGDVSGGGKVKRWRDGEAEDDGDERKSANSSEKARLNKA